MSCLFLIYILKSKEHLINIDHILLLCYDTATSWEVGGNTIDKEGAEMPDVLVRMDPDLFDLVEETEKFLARVADIVATDMSCYDDDGNYLILDPETQIDCYAEWFVATSSPRVRDLVLVEIGAFNYADRMGDIHPRLSSIRRKVLALFPVDEISNVQVTFKPVDEHHWVASR